MNILITGGSGMIGKRLTAHLLAAGYEVAWLSRKNSVKGDVNVFEWDIDAGFIEEEAIGWAQVIIHLAGENIAAKKWTPKRKQEIILSRTKSTALLKTYLDKTPNSVHTFLAASAIGYYGDRDEEILTEESPAGSGFLSDCCVQWENAVSAIKTGSIRLVLLRTGIVLDAHDGALQEMMKPLSFGIAPLFGKGSQIYSWIHIDDICRMYLYVLQNKNQDGIYNAVSPYPVTQKQMMKSIKKRKNGPALIIRLPAFLIRFILGKLSDVILISQHVSCNKISREGFTFQFGYIDNALEDILSKNSKDL